MSAGRSPGLRIGYRDGRFLRGDEPLFLVAAEYQYYRDRRENWDDRLAKLRDSGANAITFYIPWRHHLRVGDDGARCYDFDGTTKDSRDLRGFMERVAALELLMIAKPGPFVHSELNIGGLPDIVSPTFGSELPAARRHDGSPVIWAYDATVLPSAFDERFDALVTEWLGRVREVILPWVAPAGPLIGIQLNDETIYCTSNDPPWSFGYEDAALGFFRDLLAERYVDIGRYNELHGTSCASFDDVTPPALARLPAPRSTGEALALVDWAEHQWRMRRDVYARYRAVLDIDLPHLTNFAGITPPIEENIPDLQPDAAADAAALVPASHASLYPEWWLAMNRVDHDRDVHEYGMISWLGVASYDADVFARYVNTARRARGINMEENWGFGTLYDPKSRHPIVPFYQTLVSVAAGATGYVIFCGVSTDHWDDELDRVTKKQCNTFPSHAPIDEHGALRPMYHAATLLNRWFAAHGDALLRCEPRVDVAYLLYAPYAAVSSWVPDEDSWRVEGHDVPRCGRHGFEEFSRSLQDAGFAIDLFELDAAEPGDLRAPRALAMHCAYFMDERSQRALAGAIEDGARVFLSGELPEVDLELRPCTTLRDAVEAALGGGSERVTYRRENLFADGNFAAVARASGLGPGVTTGDGVRGFVHEDGAGERFVFFFGFDREGPRETFVELHGGGAIRIELMLGSKTCGALRVRDGRIASWLVKGTNEVEGIESNVRIRLGEQLIEGRGDFSG